MNTYLDKTDLTRYTERLNESLRGRIKYKGTISLYVGTPAAYRTNWNDIAPCFVGSAYVISGTEGDNIELGGVTYTVGDMIFATNEVTLLSGGGVSADVTVQKISASGGIKVVTELPTTNINSNIIYNLVTEETVVTRYDLTTEKKDAKYYMDRNGLHCHTGSIDVDVTWATVKTNWDIMYVTFFVEAATGAMYKVRKNLVDRFEYAYIPTPSTLYYYDKKSAKWYCMFDGREKVDVYQGEDKVNKRLVIDVDGKVTVEREISIGTVSISADKMSVPSGDPVTLSCTATRGTPNKLTEVNLYQGTTQIEHFTGTTVEAGYTFTKSVNITEPTLFTLESIDEAAEKATATIYIDIDPSKAYLTTSDPAAVAVEVLTKTNKFKGTMSNDWWKVVIKYPADFGDLSMIIINDVGNDIALFDKTTETISGVVYNVYTAKTECKLDNVTVEVG